MSASNRICTFFLSGLYFGLEVEEVQEVLRYQEMTRVPLAPLEVEGLINLRGQIVAAVDMRRRMGFSARPEGVLPMNVVLTPKHGSVSLLVDEIGGVLEVDEKSFESPPPTLDPALREVIRGVYKLEDRLLLVLEAAKAVAHGAAAESIH